MGAKNLKLYFQKPRPARSPNASDAPTGFDSDNDIDQSKLNQAFNEPSVASTIEEAFFGADLEPRPRLKSDDSNYMIDGSKQVTAPQLCSLASISWAADFVCMKADHPGHSLTMVSTLAYILEKTLITF